jgi:phosphate transport system substrate-binding protein
MEAMERRPVSARLSLFVVLVLALVVAGCGRDESSEPAANTGSSGDAVSGSVEADGSSTVAPLATRAAEDFQAANPDARVTVGTSGTGGGFERFCAGETDISDASRQIEPEEEKLCRDAGIQYTELQVANDGITVVVNSENDWVDCLTTDQLKQIWEPKSNVKSWKDVDASFPDEAMPLFGPGTDSGTFDFFTDKINGEEGASRSDYSATEDDNVIVQGVRGEKGGLGYFGFSYYEENQDTLKALAVDAGSGCVTPSAETVQSGEYQPLARPLFIYVKNESMSNPAVSGFVRYMVENADSLAEATQFVALTDEQAQEAQSNLQTALDGAGA